MKGLHEFCNRFFKFFLDEELSPILKFYTLQSAMNSILGVVSKEDPLNY